MVNKVLKRCGVCGRLSVCNRDLFYNFYVRKVCVGCYNKYFLLRRKAKFVRGGGGFWDIKGGGRK